jgi:hypothetical protein
MREGACAMTLQEFVTGCSEAAAKVFHLRGHISPMWHVVTRDGKHLMTPSPCPYKDDAVAPGEDVEALNARSRMLTGSLAHHPDRVEVLMLSGEDENTGLCTARRVIHRPPHGKAYLGPLEIDTPTSSEGRMVGLLPQRGTRQ